MAPGWRIIFINISPVIVFYWALPQCFIFFFVFLSHVFSWFVLFCFFGGVDLQWFNKSYRQVAIAYMNVYCDLLCHMSSPGVGIIEVMFVNFSVHDFFYPSALRAGGVFSPRPGQAGRQAGCQTSGTHISVTTWRIFSVQSSMELCRAVIVHYHGHSPICLI